MSRFASQILRLAIALVFIYAGLVKAITPVRFATDISNYHLLPWSTAVALAFYLPWLEMLSGVALLVPAGYRGSLFLLTLLTCIFIVVSVIAKARGLDVTCGCFGHVSKGWSFSWHLLLDFGVLSALAVCWALTARTVRVGDVP